MTTNSGIALPRPLRATLRSFSLYDHAPEIVADFQDGVFCLAGANGLGKSTFLSAIGFGITGTVADPGRSFTSAEEYLRDLRAYSRSAFDGRIRERDRDLAEIELELEVGPRRYRIVRNMFEPVGLRSLEITDRAGKPATNGLASTEGDRQAEYEAAITADSGLESFDQLVLLHHFVQTFDERRHLLFWDDKVSQAALFLTFGLSPDGAKQADDLRRKVERADSRARNHQYAATTAQNRMKEVAARIEELEDGPTDDEIVDELKAMEAHVAELRGILGRTTDAYRDATVARSEVSSRLRQVRLDYEVAFSSAVFGRRDPSTHPVVVSILESHQCPVCGSTHADVTAHVSAALDNQKCPICLDATIPDGTSIEDLEELDALIKSMDKDLAEGDQQVRRLLGEIDELQEQLEEAEKTLEESENRHGVDASDLGGDTDYEALIESYTRDIEDRKAKKLEARKERDKHRRELRRLQKELSNRYREVEEVFVPRFVGLAQGFLGLDLELNFEIKGDISRLVLTVDGEERRGPEDLSESQRFFVDIALRMAITLQVADPSGPPVLYIDTPEGSLDIAYERRAGELFADFVHTDASILMTANINTSEMLLRLAESCGAAKMALQRMTDWATLSDVQEEEQDAFDRAYEQIEQRLQAP